MGTMRVDECTDEAGTGAPDFPNGLTQNGGQPVGGGGSAGELETNDDSTEAESVTVAAGKRRWESDFEILVADTWTVDVGGRLVVEENLTVTGDLVVDGDCRIF